MADDCGDRKIASHVDHGPAHVQQPVDAQDQAQAFGRDSQLLQKNHHKGQGSSWYAGRAYTGEDGHANYGHLLRQIQMDTS